MISVSHLEEGQGQPVILLHGFCETREIWSSFSGSLSSRCKVILPDLPGCGLSPSLKKGFSLDDVAANLLAWMRPWLALEPIIIGHSLGGYIALAMVRRAPDIFGGVGLFHSTALPDTFEKKENRNKTISFVERHGVEAYASAFVPGLFYRKQDSLLHTVYRMAASTSKDSLIAYASAMRDRPSSIEILKSFRKPILFIAGEGDLITPADQMLEQAKLSAYPTFHSLALTGHMGMLENAKSAAGVINDFTILCSEFTE